MFYRYCNTPIATTPPIKTNKVLRTSAKLNNNNNTSSTSSTSRKSNQPAGKRSARINNEKIVKKPKLDSELVTTTDVTTKFGISDSENEQLPSEPWLLGQTKPINAEETKVGVVLRSSGKIPKSWKCINPKDISTPPKITSISKIKTPLSEPMTRILRSHKKKVNRRFKSAVSRSWSAGMVTRSHRRSVKC